MGTVIGTDAGGVNIHPDAGSPGGTIDSMKHLFDKYTQERPGMAPWPYINTLSDDELRADIELARAVFDGKGSVIEAWLALALRVRPAKLTYPPGF